MLEILFGILIHYPISFFEVIFILRLSSFLDVLLPSFSRLSSYYVVMVTFDVLFIPNLSNQISQTKPTKPTKQNLPNQTYQAKRNKPKQTYKPNQPNHSNLTKQTKANHTKPNQTKPNLPIPNGLQLHNRNTKIKFIS